MDTKVEWDDSLFITFNDRLRQRKVKGLRSEWEVWVQNKTVSANNRVKGMTGKNERGKLKLSDLRRLLKDQDYKCALSGKKLEPSDSTPDHIIPISKGGTNTVDNIQILDSSINMAKGSMCNDEFIGMCCDIVNHLEDGDHCFDGFPSGKHIEEATKTEEISAGGFIESTSCYTLKDFAKRSGLKRDALRTARNNGLRVIYVHNRGFIRGQDWFDYLESGTGGEDA